MRRWRNRILATFVIVTVAFGVYLMVEETDTLRLRDDAVAAMEASIPYRAEVEKAMQEGRQLPGPAGKPPANVRALYANSDGAVFLEFSEKFLPGGRLVFIPERGAEGVVKWRCTAERVDAEYRPPNCR